MKQVILALTVSAALVSAACGDAPSILGPSPVTVGVPAQQDSSTVPFLDVVKGEDE